ncbi:MAG: hypothetical protein ACM3ZB_09220 [bacterium]|jgi:hypothetical protein
MNVDLDSLKTEVLDYLREQGFVVFRGYSRLADTDSFVAWDVDCIPDPRESYREFLAAAKGAGVKMIVFHHREFTAGHIEEAADRLEDAGLAPDEQRQYERRLRELRGYEGFTCALELSFDHEGRIYMYSVRADWYEDYLDMLEDLDLPASEEEDDDDSMGGGYYSSN